MIVIRINEANKNVKGFFDQRGFIELIENGEIVAISSGWECNGCLYVYRYNEETKKWIGKWEDKNTFPTEEAINMQDEFNNKELIRLDIAEIISYFKDLPDIREIAEDVVKELEYYITKDDLINDCLRIEHTSDLRKWNLYCNGGEDTEDYNGQTRHKYTWTEKTRGQTSHGIQWCLVNYDDDSYCSSPSENWDILCIYIPNGYGTEDKDLIETIKQYEL